MRHIAGALLLCACHDAPAPPPTAPSLPTDAGTAIVDAQPKAAAPAPSLRELASAEDWPALKTALLALPTRDAKANYLLARACLETNDAQGTLNALSGLDMPLLSDEIDRMRATAQLEVGPYSDAAKYFSKKTDAQSMFLAAKAHLAADEKQKALALAANVIRQTHSRSLEARARALRIRTGVDPEEMKDSTWLLTKGADLPEASEVKHAPTLTKEDLVTRMRTLADAAKVDDALAEAAKMPTPLEQKRAKGDVLYRGRRYDEAAKVLSECATTNDIRAQEDAFLAARALSRADKDEDAARAWNDLIKKWPQSTWADESAFMVARLSFLHAKWSDAATGYDEYLKSHPYGVERKDALRGRAIAKLLAGDAASAKKMFTDLVKLEPDPVGRARLEDLQAIAAYKSGDAKLATDTWTRIVQTLPLSWPALASRARLADVKAPVPIAIGPAKSESARAFSTELPADVALLHEMGLDSDAEKRLAKHESELRGLESLCATYGVLDRGKRRFGFASSVSGLDLAPGPATRWAWECAFPSPYASTVTRVEASEHLPVGLTYSVMRTESGYDPEVVSPARAVGLMQLLPETAESVAKEMGRAHDRAWLTRGAYNIELGAHYLSTLLARFKDSMPLAVAAYNCGPEAVEKWTSRSVGLDVDMFVETIPYLETRGYVVRVMANYARYVYMTKGDAPSLDLAIPH